MFSEKGQHLKSVAVENGMEDKVKIIASQSFGFPLKIPKTTKAVRIIRLPIVLS